MNAIYRGAEIQAKDDMTRRTQQARAVTSLLMGALEEDDQPTSDVIYDTLAAVQTLLTRTKATVSED